MHASNVAAGTGVDQPKESSSSVGINKLGSAISPPDASKNPATKFGNECAPPKPSSSNSSGLVTLVSSSAVCFSSSDPVLVPSNDTRLPGAVGTIKWEVGGHRTSIESHAVTVTENKFPAKSQGVGKSQLTEPSQPLLATAHGSTSGSRPSSNYSSRSQQIIGPQKGN